MARNREQRLEPWFTRPFGLHFHLTALLIASAVQDRMDIIQKIEKEQLKLDIAPFKVGDTIRVHTRVVEGDKERIQIFAGIVIGRRGTGLNSTFTVRRISYGEGVERVFPLHSPRIAKIEVERAGSIRRSKLYYLRDRKGKQAMTVKEKSQN